MKIRIDLHLHSSLSAWNGDKINFESFKSAIMLLSKHDVKIGAFTDHNIFNQSFYSQVSNYAHKLGIMMMPGVEVDILRKNGQVGHLLWIISPDSDIQAFEGLVNHELGKRKVTIRKFFELAINFSSLIIPHVGKGDFLTLDDLEGFNVDAIEITNLAHDNYVRFLKSSPNVTTVAFSDTHNWKDYPQNRRLITTIETQDSEISFDNLKQWLARNQVKIIESK